QSFLAFLPALPFSVIAGAVLRRGIQRRVHPAVRAMQTGHPWYLAGCAATIALVIAYYAAQGSLGQFGYQAFLLGAQGHPVTARFALIQDMPEYITSYGLLVPALVGLIVLYLAIAIARPYELVRSLLLATVLGFVLVLTLRHPPLPARPFFVIVAYGVLVTLGLIALVATTVVHGPWL